MIRCLAIILTLSALLLAGCSEGRADDSKKNTVRIWQGFGSEEARLFEELMLEFEAEYEARTGRDITVKVDYVSFNDMFTKLKTAALADITPDIALVDAIKVTDLAFGRALLPLDELAAFKARYDSIAEARREFVPASFDEATVSRLGTTNLYALPIQTTTIALFWNREMFRDKAAGLRAAGLDPNRAPRDWNELIKYGEVLTDREKQIYGYANYNSLWFNFPILNMYESTFVEYDEQGQAKAVFDSPNTIAALEMLREILESGVEGGGWKPGGLGPDTGFQNRKYAMALCGPWKVEDFTKSGLDFGVALVPAPPQEHIDRLGLTPSNPDLAEGLGQLAYSSSNIGGQSGVIMRSCEDPELAYEVLEFFTSEAVQRRWCERLGQIPVRLAAWEGLDTSRYPYNPNFMTQLSLAKRRAQMPLFGTIETEVIMPELNLFMQGKQTAAEMARKVDRGMQEKAFDRMNEALESERDRLEAEAAAAP